MSKGTPIIIHVLLEESEFKSEIFSGVVDTGELERFFAAQSFSLVVSNATSIDLRYIDLGVVRVNRDNILSIYELMSTKEIDREGEFKKKMCLLYEMNHTYYSKDILSLSNSSSVGMETS